MALHPQAVDALRLWRQAPAVTGPGFGADQIVALRAEQRALAAAETVPPVASVEDLDAAGVRCRLYRPEDPTATVLMLHGGGFVFGDLDTHDGPARRLALDTGAAVLAVDYRRAPEHRFPAAPDDVSTVLRWWLDHAPSYRLDPRRLVSFGDSAGANLALVAALRHPGVFAATVLVYPFIDPRGRFGSYRRETGGIDAAEADWYWRQYAASPADHDDPDLAPIDSPCLGALPPTLVVAAEHDALVDEDVELARRLEAAGGTVELTTYPGMVHGFWRFPDLFDAAHEVAAEIAGFVRRRLDGPGG